MQVLKNWAPNHFRPTSLAAVAGVALLCSACAGLGDLSLDGGNNLLSSSKTQKDKNDSLANLSELDRAIVYWGQKSASNPKDLKAVLNYVRNLKAAGRKEQALNVLQQASFHHGTDREFAGEYGRLALALDQTSIAEKLLRVAEDPSKPDWRIISALATSQAKQGRYTDAIPHYQRAIQLAPNEKSLINNLAMAYAATGRAAEAEPLLRRAAATSTPGDKIHKNLALVLSLQGKDAEANQVASAPGTLRGTASAEQPTKSGWTTKVAKAQ